ncbi:hypothetical protein BH10PLA2_BH10PLA2_13610 [soil metagenome]
MTGITVFAFYRDVLLRESEKELGDESAIETLSETRDETATSVEAQLCFLNSLSGVPKAGHRYQTAFFRIKKRFCPPVTSSERKPKRRR